MATIASAHTAEQQMYVSQRPWITAQLEVKSLSFGELGLVININVRLKNIGHSPASHVQKIVAVRIDSHDLESTRQQSCGTQNTADRKDLGPRLSSNGSSRVSGPLTDPGLTIFPNEEIESDLVLQTGRAEVQRFITATAEPTRINGYQNFGILPNIVGCINYYFDLGHSNHQTGFAYTVEDNLVRDKFGNFSTGVIVLPPQETPPASRLRLIRSALYDGFSAY